MVDSRLLIECYDVISNLYLCRFYSPAFYNIIEPSTKLSVVRITVQKQCLVQ